MFGGTLNLTHFQLVQHVQQFQQQLSSCLLNFLSSCHCRDGYVVPNELSEPKDGNISRLLCYTQRNALGTCKCSRSRLLGALVKYLLRTFSLTETSS